MAAAARAFNLPKLLKNQGQRTNSTGAWSLSWSCIIVSAAPKVSVKLSLATTSLAVQWALTVKTAERPVGCSSRTLLIAKAFPLGIAKL
jgi:hypothetical protein